MHRVFRALQRAHDRTSSCAQRRKDWKSESETDAKTGDSKVVLENGAKKAEAKVPLRPVGTSGTIVEQTKPYRRLEVDSVKLVAASCDPVQ